MMMNQQKYFSAVIDCHESAHFARLKKKHSNIKTNKISIEFYDG